MRRNTLVRCFALTALLAVLPAAALAEAPSAAPLPAAAPLALDGGACPDIPGRVVDFDPAALVEGEPQPMLGCTASYNCVHGTIISCSSPLVGTCISSGQGCGLVKCDGVTTWCPGHCIGDRHCARFCNAAPFAFCDEGCCDCNL